MANFKDTILKGKEGVNFGLPMGNPKIDSSVDGVQRKTIYGVGAESKVGKTTFVDFSFLLHPYLYALEHPEIKVHWKYYSYEIDRVRKEIKLSCFFLKHDHNLTHVDLPIGVTHKGQRTIQISSRYLSSRIKDDNGNLIIIDPVIEALLEQVYEERIVPLFGRYDTNNVRTHEGMMDFITVRNNPTGRFKEIVDFASTVGEFGQHHADQFKRLDSGYTPGDDGYYIFITDHIRKIKKERVHSQGWGMKQVIDKDVEYQVDLRNNLGFSFVDICHLNRSMADMQRLKYMSDQLYPTSEDFKDSGNLSEDADVLFTMMSPNDPKYNLQTHFGTEIKDGNDPIYPGLRSLHLVQSRDTEAPQHLHLQMDGAANTFKSISQPNIGYGS